MSSTVELSALRREIDEMSVRWANATNSGDAAAIGDCLTEDVTPIAPGRPAVRGKAAAVAEAQTWIDSGATNEAFETIEVFGDGNLAYHVGTYSVDYPQEDGSLRTEKGSYVDICRRQEDGSWRIHVSIAKSDSE